MLVSQLEYLPRCQERKNRMKRGGADDFIIHPERGRNEKKIPPAGIFFVNPSEARMGLGILRAQGGTQQFLFHSGLMISPGNDFFVAGPAVGAPMAVMTFEKLIALGASSVIMSGWCGGIDKNLQVGDTILGGTAHCGEGTSRYYSQDSFCQPSPMLLQKLQRGFTEEDVPSVPIWSTDAPYRESRAMVEALCKNLGWVVSIWNIQPSALLQPAGA